MSLDSRVERLESRMLLSGSVVARLPDRTRLVENGASLTRVYPDGSVDLAFGTAGSATISLAGAELGPVALQPDGKILVGGEVGPTMSVALDVSGITLLLARFNNDGTLDRSFGSGGIVLAALPQRTDDGCSQIIVQPDGKIVAAGSAYTGLGDPGFRGIVPFLFRYDSAGNLDPSFGNNGTVLMSVPHTVGASIDAVKLERGGSFAVTLTGIIDDTGQSFRVTQHLDANGNPPPARPAKAPPTAADVVPSSFSMPRFPPAVIPGATGVAVIRLSNEGGTGAKGQGQFTIYAVNPSANGASGPTAVAAFTHNVRVAPGKSLSVRVRFTFSQPLTAGTYQFLATTSGAGITGSPAITGPTHAVR